MLQRFFQPTQPVPKRPAVYIRDVLRMDLPEILEVERACFARPWREAEFCEAMFSTGHPCIGFVAEAGNRTVGFVLHRFQRDRAEIVKLAVAPEHRRRGVGEAMVAKILSHPNIGPHRPLWAVVPERDLDAQLFFRAMGFVATAIHEAHDPETGDAAYRFTFGSEDETCLGR